MTPLDRIASVARLAYFGRNHVMTAVGWDEWDKVNKGKWRKVARTVLREARKK